MSACAVPRCGSWTTKVSPDRPSSAALSVSARWPMTTVVLAGRTEVAVARTCSIIGTPDTRSSTFGSSDFIRVPLPAARTTMWTSDMTSRLSRCSGSERAAWTVPGTGPGVECRAEGVIAPQRLEVGVSFGQTPVFGVECDGALEVGDRFGVLGALRVRDSQHVQRVVVVRIFVAHEAEVGDRLIV